MKKILITCCMAFIILGMYSCKEDPPVFEATPYDFVIPPLFPTDLNIPEDNPLTVEGVELGRHLFYDGRLSGRTDPDSLLTCSSCHRQNRSFEPGNDHPVYTGGFTHGITGKPTPHVPLPLINLIWNTNGYLWNGAIYEENTRLGLAPYGIPEQEPYHFKNIESLVWMGMAAPHEMNTDPNKVIDLLKTIDIYPPMYEAAFGTPEVTLERTMKAVASFIRTIIAYNSKVHRVFRGEDNFNPAEQRGYVLFMTEVGSDCFHCHGTEGAPTFTTNLFYNNGKDTSFTGINEDIRDRYHVTLDPQDYGAYKATTLINIVHQGPYMHDGRFATLMDVIDFYSEGLAWSPYVDPLMHQIANNGVQLNPAEKLDLLAYLHAMTDTVVMTDPKYSNPRPNDPFFIEW